jgi:hypothetical protein
MQQVQLYVDGQRVDLFKDETISFTQSIQNIKDPAKIFTDFSKSFSVPASKDNNKIFKHFYNYDIINGFDARQKVPAEIQLNFTRFKKGYIKLEGVDLKNNKPNTYRITFFGETVNLKDLVGDDELSALSWLDNFVKPYNSGNVETGLTTGHNFTVNFVFYEDALVTPLITHTKRLYYDSGSTVNESGNLYYNASTTQGVLWSDLKYSIRLHVILKAIEKQYNITFSDDFFSNSNNSWYDLYLWMHRTKGDAASSLTGNPVFSKLVRWGNIAWTPINTTDKIYVEDENGNGFYIEKEATDYITSTIEIDTLDPDAYDIYVKKDGLTIYSQQNVTGSETVNLFDMQDGFYTLVLESENSVTFSVQNWEFNLETIDNSYVGDSDSFNGNIQTVFDYYPTQQVPKIKVIDFLTGIFKMFNLTAYVDEGIIVVKTLNSYYNVSTEWDLSKYINVEKSSVDSALPYKQITFEFDGVKTFLSSKFEQLTGEYYGKLKYTQNNGQFEGADYKIKIPFEKPIYERLTDANTGNLTTIQFGWSADDKQEAYLGKAWVHYVNNPSPATGISFRTTETTQTQLTSYFIPLNSRIGGLALTFKAEIDEYSQNQNTNNLFENFYKEYIVDAFDFKRRIIKLSAILPLNIFNKIKLSDKIVINNRRFIINSIDTNLQTGESELELLNEINVLDI